MTTSTKSIKEEFSVSELHRVFAEKLTENGDVAYNTTGNKLLDILFMSEYFGKHLDEVRIGDSDVEKLFSMFIRDPRHGLGRRDLGRVLMYQSDVCAEDVVKAGRYDDLLVIGEMEIGKNAKYELPLSMERYCEFIYFIVEKAKEGDYLAKKWLPRPTGKDKKVAGIIKRILKISNDEYRALIKNVDTTEYKLSYHETKNSLVQTLVDGKVTSEQVKLNVEHPLLSTIDYEKVESLAMLKYFQTFKRKDQERFNSYLESVKKGEKKLNVSTTNVYDIYKNRDVIEPDIFFDKIEKVPMSVLPIIDTSGSMQDSNDSMGKAISIGHYLAKCSTYAPNMAVAFSSNPHLIELGVAQSSLRWGNPINSTNTPYKRELASLYTGDCSNTDLGKVMDLLSKLNSFPDYLVILSDMEFDSGSRKSKDECMRIFKEKGAQTKIVWWNFNSRNRTSCEMDEYGNIYLSGYSPQLLKYLESGFDGSKFLEKLLSEYKNKVTGHGETQ